MTEFTIYPAIDLRNGQVVRLKQGNPDEQTTYSHDPGLVAKSFITSGARWIHVVDLDGAFSERNRANLAAMESILSGIGNGNQVQLGGGIRDLRTIENILRFGVSRVILGTAAIENPAFARRALIEFGGDQVVFGLDALDGVLKTRGWRESSKETVSGFGAYLSANGAKTLIYTNIRRDGMGSGVDWENAKRLANETGLEVIASGGVNTLDDVKSVKTAGLGGVIIGRALYENKISLREALTC